MRADESAYPRDPVRLTACIEILLSAGAHTRYDVSDVLPILRGRNDELAALLDADPELLQHFIIPQNAQCPLSVATSITG